MGWSSVRGSKRKEEAEDEAEVRVNSNEDSTLPSGRGLSRSVSVNDSEGKRGSFPRSSSTKGEVADVDEGARKTSAARTRARLVIRVRLVRE